MTDYLLGIDIGTSACKVALFKTNGEVVAQKSGAYKVYYPKKGWAEQEPEEWWEAVASTLRALLKENQIEVERIRGIGVDGQSWSAIAIDEEGKVLCPTPIWMDTRAKAICEEIKAQISEEEIFESCGNPLEPSYTLPKILWYKKHRPEIYAQTHQILQSNSFIVYKLTEKLSQDKSQGYGYQCFNMRQGTWDKELCKKLGIKESLLPPLYDCHEVVGYVTEKAAKETGLKVGIPVVAGGLDAACGTLGAGVLHNGQTQEQGGQAGGMSICTNTYRADKRLILSYHVVPNTWLLQGGTVGGGGVIKWFEEQFGAAERQLAKEKGTHSFEEMSSEAGEVAPGSEGLVFLPYMAGERSPIWNPKARGVYFGLDYAKTRAHMIRASFEGVAYSLKHNLDIAEEAGAEVEELHAMGGAANSQVWTQIKADVTGKKISVPASDTATTLGAALLAGVGVGLYKDFDEAVEKTVAIKRVHLPNKENAQCYAHYFEIYKKLYQKLEGLMEEL
ncbi:xylulokinase [Sporanaerobium hydrogeniformans]|uniref:Xylulokinase n=1 Tax=Sporanaerobium hydrogeniformans TaxID=3072179 RepID=A0AC61DFS3_9FIRM|nr:xylulokinase [Sporanaerobium hydrogeniformans]PHV72135.1 xylulokinase [Sporanaerobium hydrogeniformans]